MDNDTTEDRGDVATLEAESPAEDLGISVYETGDARDPGSGGVAASALMLGAVGLLVVGLIGFLLVRTSDLDERVDVLSEQLAASEASRDALESEVAVVGQQLAPDGEVTAMLTALSDRLAELEGTTSSTGASDGVVDRLQRTVANLQASFDRLQRCFDNLRVYDHATAADGSISPRHSVYC